MTGKNDILAIAQTLDSGQTTQGKTCPYCRGGHSGKKSFYVTRNADGILYVCHRASCQYRGFIPTTPSLLRPDQHETKLKPYKGELLPLTEADLEFFANRFGIYPEGDFYVNEYEEYVLPIQNPLSDVVSGAHRGYVVRQPWQTPPYRAPRLGRPGRPKARTWMHARKPAQSFYCFADPWINLPLIVVEDQISAYKVAMTGKCHAVALLGVNVDTDKVREWSTLKPSRVVFALDPDAEATSFGLARKWGLAFRNLRVALLEKDPKDLSYDELAEGLELA